MDRAKKMEIPSFITEHREEILEIAERRGFFNVRVFGSMARGDFTDESDLDLLVEARERTSAFDLGGMIVETEELLKRKVDVVTLGCLLDAMHERVLRDALPL